MAPPQNEEQAVFLFSPGHSVLGRAVVQWQAQLSPVDTSPIPHTQAYSTRRCRRYFNQQPLISLIGEVGRILGIFCGASPEERVRARTRVYTSSLSHNAKSAKFSHRHSISSCASGADFTSSAFLQTFCCQKFSRSFKQYIHPSISPLICLSTVSIHLAGKLNHLSFMPFGCKFTS